MSRRSRAHIVVTQPVSCCGETHTVSLTNTGRLVLHDHRPCRLASEIALAGLNPDPGIHMPACFGLLLEWQSSGKLGGHGRDYQRLEPYHSAAKDLREGRVRSIKAPNESLAERAARRTEQVIRDLLRPPDNTAPGSPPPGPDARASRYDGIRYTSSYGGISSFNVRITRLGAGPDRARFFDHVDSLIEEGDIFSERIKDRTVTFSVPVSWLARVWYPGIAVLEGVLTLAAWRVVIPPKGLRPPAFDAVHTAVIAARTGEFGRGEKILRCETRVVGVRRLPDEAPPLHYERTRRRFELLTARTLPELRQKIRLPHFPFRDNDPETVEYLSWS